MNKYDLSVLIPARNERFVARTVQDILENKRGKTEVLVGLDGEWADPAIASHPDLTTFYSPSPLGQRGMTNQLARISRAKYVMKLDAHCALDEGFDVKMMEVMEDDITLVPLMRNLHAFDWVCINGHRRYQGPSGPCKDCGAETTRDVLWKAKESPRSTAFRFDKTLHFQYWNDFKKRPEGKGDLTETLSIQGSCFMLTREKFWELDISDEKLAGKTGWGQQGVEVALKTWLSGGRVLCNQKTWYAHMFRTQGGDFGFPFPISGSEVDETRKKSRRAFVDGEWNKALPGRNLQWVLDKFYPVPDWHDNKEEKTKSAVNGSKGIVFYTDNTLNTKIAHKVQNQLRKTLLPISSSSLKPMPHFGTNVSFPLERGVITYFVQIISALKNLKTDIVYFCEHDVLYHPSHFDFIPAQKDKFYYNQNFWRVREDGFAVHWDANQVSGLVCYRELALEYYQKRLEQIAKEGFNRSYEPGGRDKTKYEVFQSQFPNVDIRYGNTLTKSKWSPSDFRDKSTCVNWQEGRIELIPGWDLTKESVFPQR